MIISNRVVSIFILGTFWIIFWYSKQNLLKGYGIFSVSNFTINDELALSSIWVHNKHYNTNHRNHVIIQTVINLLSLLCICTITIIHLFDWRFCLFQSVKFEDYINTIVTIYVSMFIVVLVEFELQKHNSKILFRPLKSCKL